MASESVSEHIVKNGGYKDMREYQELKVSNEMERAATAQYKEHLTRKHGDTAAQKIMKRKGWDAGLAKR